MTASLVKFDFHGDELWVQKIGDSLFVTLKSMCDAIEISDEPQR